MSRLEKVKSFLTKAAKTLLPVAAGMITGMVAPQFSVIVSNFIAAKLRDYKINANLPKLKATVGKVINRENMDEVKEAIQDAIEDEEKPEETIIAAVEYALRPLYASLEEAISYLRSEPEEIKRILIELGFRYEEITRKLEEMRLEFTEYVATSTEKLSKELRIIERRLDQMFLEFCGRIAKSPTINVGDMLDILSKNQLQMAMMSSRYDIQYTPELYVNRSPTESCFDDFVNSVEYSIGKTKNLFLVLADAGMGKTWLLAHLASKLSEKNKKVFFVSLRLGLKDYLETIFKRSLDQIISMFETLFDETNAVSYLFLDGLDEVAPYERASVLRFVISASRTKGLAIVLSCRIADWIYDHNIRDLYGELIPAIYGEKRVVGIETPMSVTLEEFTENELARAIEKYGIPELSGQLRTIAKKPYILRLITEWYYKRKSLPDPMSEAFLEFIAGVENSVFSRMGIIGEVKEDLFKIIETIVQEGKKEVLLSKVLSRINERSWVIIRSSGLVLIKELPYGAIISINPVFASHLIRLLLKRVPEKDQAEYLKNLARIDPVLVQTLKKIPKPEKVAASSKVRIDPELEKRVIALLRLEKRLKKLEQEIRKKRNDATYKILRPIHIPKDIIRRFQIDVDRIDMLGNIPIYMSKDKVFGVTSTKEINYLIKFLNSMGIGYIQAQLTTDQIRPIDTNKDVVQIGRAYFNKDYVMDILGLGFKNAMIPDRPGPIMFYNDFLVIVLAPITMENGK